MWRKVDDFYIPNFKKTWMCSKFCICRKDDYFHISKLNQNRSVEKLIILILQIKNHKCV